VATPRLTNRLQMVVDKRVAIQPQLATKHQHVLAMRRQHAVTIQEQKKRDRIHLRAQKHVAMIRLADKIQDQKNHAQSQHALNHAVAAAATTAEAVLLGIRLLLRQAAMIAAADVAAVVQPLADHLVVVALVEVEDFN
jgi:hypothetical protein